MQHSKIITTIIALMIAASAAIMIIPGADATEEDVQILYTYSPTIISTATDAQHISWDFGDGSPILNSKDALSEDSAVVDAYNVLLAANGGNVWAPVHTYSAIGDYTITQVVWNPYDPEGTGEGSTDSITKQIRIMGHPTITLMSRSETIGTIEVPKCGPDADYLPNAATCPEDPVDEGMTFAGWYTDPDCTVAYDWDAPVSKHITLYAKWTAVPGPEDPSDPEVPGEDKTDDISIINDRELMISAGAGILGLIGLLVGMRSGHRGVALVGLLVMVAGGMSAYAESVGTDLIAWINDLIGGGSS